MKAASKKRKSRNLQKHDSKKAGLPPGSLVYTGDTKKEVSVIDIFNYSEKSYLEKKIGSIQECTKFISPDTVTWINIEGLNQVNIIEQLGEEFGIDDLVLEDTLHTNQRAKLEERKKFKYIVLKMLSYNENFKQIDSEQVSIIFGNNYVITLQEGKEGDLFPPIRERIRIDNTTIRKMGTDFLVYSLLDVIIDNYFIILEKIGEEIETADEELMIHPKQDILHRIYDLKREIIFIRKSIWPLREAMSKLERLEDGFIQDKTKLYYKDLYDHIIQAIDNVENSRDLISGMMDLYLSSLSNKMNEIMKVLTMMGTIFIPLTFIAGVYGMNFEYQPELKWKFGYPLIWFVMLIITVFLIVYFRRKKWIG